MGTRSRIGIRNADDSVDSIYVHRDGSPEYNGCILLENYQDEAKIRTMITLGNLSSIGAEIGERHPYPFDKLDSPGSYTAYERTYGHMCLAYGRDRGEDDMGAIHSQSVEDFLSIRCDAEYYYIWHYGRWMVRPTWGDNADKWQLVHDLLGVDLHGKSLALVIKAWP